MAHNKINDLRDHLFDVIERLKDPKDKTIDLETAKVICDAAQVIVNSAKVEVDYVRASGINQSDSDYFKPVNATKQLTQ